MIGSKEALGSNIGIDFKTRILNPQFSRLEKIQKTLNVDENYQTHQYLRDITGILTEYFPDELVNQAKYLVLKNVANIWGISNNGKLVVNCLAAIDIILRSSGKFVHEDIIRDIAEKIEYPVTLKEFRSARVMLLQQYPEHDLRRQPIEALYNVLRGEIFRLSNSYQVTQYNANISAKIDMLRKKKFVFSKTETVALALLLLSIDETEKNKLQRIIMKNYDDTEKKVIFNCCYRIKKLLTE